MLHLKKIIQQLDKDGFEEVAATLKKVKTGKFHALLHFYKEGKLSDEEMQAKLSVNINAFNMLNHRLFDKLQEHLREKSAGELTGTLKQLVYIPNLVYNTDKKVAAAVLTKLEKEFLENDMPHELTNVYAALKKIHSHTSKYYNYSQRYNKHIAYTLALDKAEDLLCRFTAQLGEYYLSRKKDSLPVFAVIKREMANLNALYKSHHLKVYQNIVDVSIALFLPLPDVVKDDKPVEDILNETESILSAYSKDSNYRYLNTVLYYLFYEYYHKHNLHKKEMQYLELIPMPEFLYYNHTVFCSRFLISTIETHLSLNKAIEKEAWKYNPEKSDAPNYVNYVKYLAACRFNAQNYMEAAKHLSTLLNEVGFLHYPHAEIEIKLFLTLCYCMSNKYEQAHVLLLSARRKISELNDDLSYENARIFGKMLEMQTRSSLIRKEMKILALKNQFELLNKGDNRMLQYLKLDDNFMQQFIKPVK